MMGGGDGVGVSHPNVSCCPPPGRRWAPSMIGAELHELIDDWLAAADRTPWLRFPPPLERRYEADIGPARSRTMMICGLFGFVLAAFIYPAVRDTMPDIAGQCRTLFLFTVVPFGLLLSAAIGLNLRPFFRESLALLANSACICTSAYLEALTRSPHTEFFVAGTTVLMVYSAIGIQLRFRFAACAMVLILLTYGLAMHVRADMSATSQRNLLSMVACTAVYLLLANWRLEREARRGYLNTLREVLQGQDLSVRNLELDALARRDQLTGLANRRAYDAWVLSTWEQQAAHGGRLGLIVIDVDRFKAYNDFYGHAAGDRCLQTIGLCLREQLRGTTDLVARLGGEEFAILLPGLDEQLCADIAERMRTAIRLLELPHSGLGPHGLVSISAGVASHPATLEELPSGLFDAADSALYQAKLSGRDRVCVALQVEHETVQAPAE